MQNTNTISEEYSDINAKIEAVEGELFEVLKILANNGGYYAQMFQEGRSLAFEEGDRKEFTTLGTRCRMKGQYLSAEWYRNVNFSRDAKTASGAKRKMYSRYIKKNKPFGYSKDTFKSEPLWAQQMALMVEDRYTSIREVNHKVREIKRNLTGIKNIVAKFQEADKGLIK